MEQSDMDKTLEEIYVMANIAQSEGYRVLLAIVPNQETLGIVIEKIDTQSESP